MNPIVAALKEEQREANKLSKLYSKELKTLPQGSFFARKMGKSYYGYITYSESGKIKQKYLGKLSLSQIKENEKQMERKKKLMSLKKQIEKQKQFLEKALRHAC